MSMYVNKLLLITLLKIIFYQLFLDFNFCKKGEDIFLLNHSCLLIDLKTWETMRGKKKTRHFHFQNQLNCIISILFIRY